MTADLPSVTLVRHLRATPARVFAALTDPALMVRWWGPDAGPTLRADADVRPGGRYSVTFRCLNGEEYTPTGKYREVIPGEKLVFTWELPGALEPDSLVTLLLVAVDGGTELTLIHERLPNAESRSSHAKGWTGWMDKLAAFTEQQLVLTTFDWVPELPRGYVRDIRVRWALEEAGLPYRVESVPFDDRKLEHYAHQPFGQVPWLNDGDISIFESGAILLHLGAKSSKLLPVDTRERSDAIEWLFAALNSVEMATLPFSIFQFTGDNEQTPGRQLLDGFLAKRLEHMNGVVEKREWLAGQFTVADILMADVLRLVDRFHGLEAYPNCRSYVQRATARPAFVKAHADQLAHFAAAKSS